MIESIEVNGSTLKEIYELINKYIEQGTRIFVSCQSMHNINMLNNLELITVDENYYSDDSLPETYKWLKEQIGYYPIWGFLCTEDIMCCYDNFEESLFKCGARGDSDELYIPNNLIIADYDCLINPILTGFHAWVDIMFNSVEKSMNYILYRKGIDLCQVLVKEIHKEAILQVDIDIRNM
jgi:hypothetical protein